MSADSNIDNLSHIMAAIENIDSASQVAAAIQLLPFSELTQTTWLGVQRQQENVVELLKILRVSLTEGAKLVGNDAVLSHIGAVITAD